MDGLNNAFGGMSEQEKKAFKKIEDNVALETRTTEEEDKYLVANALKNADYGSSFREIKSKENENLLQQIKESELYGDETKEEFRKRELNRKELSTNLADMVVMDTKWYGEGSKEMLHVQAQVIVLFDLLEEKVGEGSFETLKKVSAQFDEAISACRFYESKKNPWFPTGKRRKKMVEDLRTQLEIQRNNYNSMLPMFSEKANYGIDTPMDILLLQSQESFEITERRLAKDEKRPGAFMDFESLPEEDIKGYKGNIGKEEELKKKEDELDQDISELKEYISNLESQNKRYNYKDIPMPKHQKGLAERSAAKATRVMLIDNINMRDKSLGLKAYKGKNGAADAKDLLTSDFANKNKLIDDALNGDYAFYNELKDEKTKDDANKRDVIKKSKLDDMSILQTLLKEGNENVEYNKKLIDAVFTKGLAYDNLHAEKLKPYLENAVSDFLKMSISKKMLDDKYFPNHVAELMSFFRHANMLHRFYEGYKEEKNRLNSPFYFYYMHSLPPQVRGLIEQKVKMAMPLFELFKIKCEEKKIPLKDIGADRDTLKIAQFSSAYVYNKGAGVEKGADYTPEQKKEAAEILFEEYEKDYLENAEVYSKSTLFADKVNYVKDLNDKIGDGLFLADDMARVKSLRKRVRGENDEGIENPDFVYNTAGLQKDIEDIEHILDSILYTRLSLNDFKDIDKVFTAADYAYNMQLFKLVHAGGSFLEEYEAMISMKGAKCKYKKADIVKIQEKIDEIEHCERLYKTVESVVLDPLFDYNECKKLLSLSEKERKRIMNEASDYIGGSEVSEYYAKINKLADESKGVINLTLKKGFFERLFGSNNSNNPNNPDNANAAN